MPSPIPSSKSELRSTRKVPLTSLKAADSDLGPNGHMSLHTMLRALAGLLCISLKRSDSLLSSRTPRGLLDNREESRNIVILGSLGVGKSSLVNMLIGKVVAPVSNSVRVAHPSIVEYSIPLSEISQKSSLSTSDYDLTLKFYDTLGLEHRPSPWRAIKACLKRSGGVRLVVYCMRRGRLSREQVTHLDTIWKTVCREGDVPLVLVIGDIGHHHGSPEEWWEMNGKGLENAAQVRFNDHICLNTWHPAHPSWEDQGTSYEETQKLVRDLVIRYCRSLHGDT